MPCFPGAVGIREKRLHCRNDPEREGWRKGRAYARLQGRKSLESQERSQRGWGEMWGLRLGLWVFLPACGSSDFLGVCGTHPFPPWELQKGTGQLGPLAEVRLSPSVVLQPSIRVPGESASCGAGSSGCRGLSTTPKRDKGRERLAPGKRSTPSSSLHDQRNEVAAGPSMQRTSWTPRRGGDASPGLLTLEQGSPTPGLRTSIGPWSVRNQAVQQEVSGR